jgi:hypothetical protein
MDHRFGTLDQRCEAFRPIERAIDPLDTGLRRLRTAGERAHAMAAFTGEADQVASDETGAACDRKRRQSITI